MMFIRNIPKNHQEIIIAGGKNFDTENLIEKMIYTEFICDIRCGNEEKLIQFDEMRKVDAREIVTKM